MAREGSKRGIAIEIMNSNANKPMAEVLELIATANGIDAGAARSYYVYLVKNGMAKGNVEAKAPKAKAEKPAKEKAVKRMAKEVAAKAVKAVKPAGPVKSAEEIEKIKAANMARMKAVLAKTKQNVVKDEVEEAPAFAETDAFAAPAFLTKEDVISLV
jgi:hypothetical protein